MQQDVGGRIIVEEVAEAAELLGMLLVKVDRLEIEPIQEPEPPQPVGPLDGDRRLAVPLQYPLHQFTISPGPGRIAADHLALRIRPRLRLKVPPSRSLTSLPLASRELARPGLSTAWIALPARPAVQPEQGSASSHTRFAESLRFAENE